MQQHCVPKRIYELPADAERRYLSCMSVQQAAPFQVCGVADEYSMRQLTLPTAVYCRQLSATSFRPTSSRHCGPLRRPHSGVAGPGLPHECMPIDTQHGCRRNRCLVDGSAVPLSGMRHGEKRAGQCSALSWAQLCGWEEDMVPRGAAQAACLEQEGGDHLRNMRWRNPTRAKRSRAIRAVRPGGIPTACTARATGTKRRIDTPPKSSNPESVRLFASDCERAVATGEKTAYSGALLCGRVASNMRHDDSPQIRRTYVHAPTYMWCIGRPQDDAGGLMRTHRAGGSAHAPTGSMGGRRSHTESQDHCANDQTGKVTR
jgi:hypothetical protein